MGNLEYESLIGQAILYPEKANRCLDRWLLRAAVSQQMFCRCGAILDCRTGALVECETFTFVFCPRCYEVAKDVIKEKYPDAKVIEGKKPRMKKTGA